MRGVFSQIIMTVIFFQEVVQQHGGLDDPGALLDVEE